MNVRTVIVLFLLLPAACACTTSNRQGKKVGGCIIDTIPLGLGMVRDRAPKGEAARVEILSLEFAGEEMYRLIARELTMLLDSLKVTVYDRSELIHIKKGPCWPPYRITFHVAAESIEKTEKLRSELLKTPLAARSPSAERAKGYGLFFIACGKGDKDWWTLWYEGK